MRPALVLVLLVIALPSTAQFDSGDIGIFADVAGTQSALNVVPGVPFLVHVVAFDPPGGITAFELDLSDNIGIGSTTFLLSQTVVSGVDTDDDPYRLRVVTDACVEGEAVVLATIQLLSVTPILSDGSICVGGAFTYVDCAGIERPFGVAQSGGDLYPDGCLIVNPTIPGCCPSYEDTFDMPEVLAMPGETKRLPLRHAAISTSSCGTVERTSCEGRSTFGFAGDLVFDPALLSLRGVTLGGAAPEWELEVTAVEAGRFAVRTWSAPELEGLDYGSELGDLQNDALLQLEFDVLAPGTAFVTFENAGVCSRDHWNDPPCAFATNRTITGAITQDPVSDDATTFGTLKARFGGD